MLYVKKKGFKVSLSGSGADEIYGGYYDHYLMIFNELRKIIQKNSSCLKKFGVKYKATFAEIKSLKDIIYFLKIEILGVIFLIISTTINGFVKKK